MVNAKIIAFVQKMILAIGLVDHYMLVIETKGQTHMTHSYINVDAIKASYAPYHTMYAFQVGYDAAMAGCSVWNHPYRGVDEQAYDRGLEAAIKVKAAARWIETSVGAD